MKNKVFEAMKNLQLFAEGGGAGTGGPGDGGGTDGKNGAGSGGEGGSGDEPVSFDDFLKQEGNQAEFDRRVQKAIDTAVSNAQKKWKDIHDDKLSEAEKLAKMTNEEKAAYRMSQMEKELNAFTKFFKDAVQDAIKTKYKGEPPKKGTGGKSNLTKDQIMSVKDPIERQKLIAENMELFQK